MTTVEAVHVRIFQCLTCKSTQVIPDFLGHPPAQDDVYLADLVLAHGNGHTVKLFRVEESHWDTPNLRQQMLEEMWSGTTGFAPSHYDVQETFKDDAAKCWIAHHRPGVSTHLCNDYHNDNKRIGNPAFRDRKKLAAELGNDNIKFSGPKVYLCDGFCPYGMEVQRMKADKYGDFSDKLI